MSVQKPIGEQDVGVGGEERASRVDVAGHVPVAGEDFRVRADEWRDHLALELDLLVVK